MDSRFSLGVKRRMEVSRVGLDIEGDDEEAMIAKKTSADRAYGYTMGIPTPGER